MIQTNVNSLQSKQNVSSDMRRHVELDYYDEFDGDDIIGTIIGMYLVLLNRRS